MTMIEYARCIYLAWARLHTAEYIETHEQEVLDLISRALGYTQQELRTRLCNETWYLH